MSEHTKTPDKSLLWCSFCGKNDREVKKLVAGPGAMICDECIELCVEVVSEDLEIAETLRVAIARAALAKAGGK